MTMSPIVVHTARRKPGAAHRSVREAIQTEGFQPGPGAIANFEIALECLEPDDYASCENAMIWGEYGFALRFPRPADPQPIGKRIERFERLRADNRGLKAVEVCPDGKAAFRFPLSLH